MRFLMIAATTFLLGACDFVETFQEVQSQAEAAAAILEQDVFDGTKVAAMSVRELESKVRKAVGSSFKEQPQQLMVSARWEQ